MTKDTPKYTPFKAALRVQSAPRFVLLARNHGSLVHAGILALRLPDGAPLGLLLLPPPSPWPVKAWHSKSGMGIHPSKIPSDGFRLPLRIRYESHLDAPVTNR